MGPGGQRFESARPDYLHREAQGDRDLKQRHSEIMQQQDRLLNLRLLEEIDAGTYAAKAQALRDQEAELRLKIEAIQRSRYEIADIAVKAFELPNSWPSAVPP